MIGLMVADGLPFTPALVALPAVWLVEGILTLGFCLLIAAVGILMRDIQHLIGVVLLFWFYLTPIFYDLKQIPPDLGRWFSINPMSAIVSAHRGILLHGEFPNWRELGLWALVGVGLLAVSAGVFRQLEDAFIDAT
jgi:homopolymeric O-antigen transport system permease protein